MRKLLPPLIFAASCGSSPPPVKAVPQIVRELDLSLAAERGEATVLIDGAERLHAAGSGGSNLVFDLRPGRHQLTLRGHVMQYGGMGTTMTVGIDDAPLVSLACGVPCDPARLEAWGNALQADPARTKVSCAGAEIRGVSSKSEADGSFTVDLIIELADKKGPCP